MIEQPCGDQSGLSAQDPRVIANDWPWLCRYREANLAAQAAPPQVVFMGDSITEGWGYSDADFFVLGGSRNWSNRGISGQTSPQMLVRFWPDVIALRPKVVHIMGGTNDIAGNTGPNRPEDFKNNIRAMVALAKANDIAVVLASIPPTNVFSWRPELQPAVRIAALNRWLKDFAASSGLVYADYFAAMVVKDGAMNPDYTGDGVHPEAAGYAVMRPIAERAIAQALAGK